MVSNKSRKSRGKKNHEESDVNVKETSDNLKESESKEIAMQKPNNSKGVSKKKPIRKVKAKLSKQQVTEIINDDLNSVDSKTVIERKDTMPDRYTCWLMKSEPDTRMENGVDVKFGFDDLKACPDKTSYWDGVRNYQARNFMRDQMKVGDKVFFYHSNTKVPGIVGVCSISREAYPDHTQFDKKSSYYDAKSDKKNPRWLMVDVKYEYDLKRYVPLHELKEIHQEHKANGGPLRNIALFTKARLSVQPVSEEEWHFIIKLSEKSD